MQSVVLNLPLLNHRQIMSTNKVVVVKIVAKTESIQPIWVPPKTGSQLTFNVTTGFNGDS